MTSSPSLITGSSLPPAGGVSAIRRARRPSRACPGASAVTKTGENSDVTSGENCSATHRKVYRSRDEARADVFDYIERFYNPVRRHSTIGYLSPVEFERQVGLA
jgi:transposase InsO family protein